jgi:trk system potassium uptake protein TrkH
MQRILDLPFLVILMGIGALAMYVPAAHGLILRDHAEARAFFYSGTLFLVFAAMIGVATANYNPRNAGHSHLLALAAAYLLLPLMLAVPFSEAVRDTRFSSAWFEMVSSFTTTGATLYEPPGRLPPSVHLWRGLVGWLGGFFTLLTALAILAPLNLGGFEVSEAGPDGISAARRDTAVALASDRLTRYAVSLAPVYAGLTALLWVGLLIAGETGLVAFMHAMAILSTSGISPVGGTGGGQSGLAGEMLMFFFLLFALSRHTMPGGVTGGVRQLRDDPELRMGLAIVALATAVLFLRHWAGALAEPLEDDGAGVALRALWGAAFTVMSFMTTTGFISEAWESARFWSGIGAPGLMMVGLAMIGGGIATTAGGVKLLRIFALYKHGMREMEKLVHPSSIGGAGTAARRLRRQGAFAAWVFFMLYAVSIAVVMLALGLSGIGYEAGLIYTISALSTTGQLAWIATETPLSYVTLSGAAKAVLALAMVVGRLETLAIIALLAPDMWRK